MFDVLTTILAVIGAASLLAFLAAYVGDVVRRYRNRRWQREYERELKDAEESLSRDVESWLWSKGVPR